jgi:hypothetical protein
VLAGVAALAVPQGTNAVSNEQPPKAHQPTLLWNAFPLQQQPARPRTRPRVSVTTGKSRAASTSVRPQPHADHGRSWNWLWILAGVALVLLATAIAVAALSSRSRHRGGRMSKFRLIRTGDRSPESVQTSGFEAIAREEEQEIAASVSPPADAEASDVGGVLAPARLGDHVNAVLQAAEDAAARIQDEAQEAARKDAEELKAEAQRLRSDAARFTKRARAAAEKEAANRRAKAEAEAEDVLAQAEDEAEEILLEAERQAASVKQDAERRHETLNKDVTLAEDRLRELANGLYELAERLEDLLGTPLEDGEEEPEAAEDDASIVDVLTPTPVQAEQAQGSERSSAWG